MGLKRVASGDVAGGLPSTKVCVPPAGRLRGSGENKCPLHLAAIRQNFVRSFVLTILALGRFSGLIRERETDGARSGKMGEDDPTMNSEAAQS